MSNQELILGYEKHSATKGRLIYHCLRVLSQENVEEGIKIFFKGWETKSIIPALGQRRKEDLQIYNSNCLLTLKLIVVFDFFL